MSDVATSKGASVVVVGAGVTGLSTAWWLARSGVDVLVIDKGVVGWEASGRNGGGCTHHQSPLFAEEQRLWPMMDELLGYPTEFQPRRLRIALTDEQLETMKRGVDSARAQGFPAEWLDRRPGAGDGAADGRQCRRGRLFRLRRPRQSAADRPGLCLGAPRSRRAYPAECRGDGFHARGRQGQSRRDGRRGLCLRTGGRRGGAANRRSVGDARGGGSGRSRARGDDRDGAAAADADGRNRRQRPLWTPDPARQSRLWRRPA